MRFEPPRQAQKFLSIYDQVFNLFRFPRNRLSAIDHRATRARAFVIWDEITNTRLAT